MENIHLYELYRAAVVEGDSCLITGLDYCIKEDYNNGIDDVIKAANRGGKLAELVLAVISLKGQTDSVFGKEQVDSILRLESIVPLATTFIGKLYHFGIFCEINYGTAFNYYEDGAKAGEPIAQNYLGCMYRDGQGVNVDESMAAEWFKKSCGNGCALAMTNLGHLYLQETRVQDNSEIAMELFRNAIKIGDQRAFTGLAILYLEGFNDTINLKEVLELLLQGATADDSDYINWLPLGEFYATKRSFYDKDLAIQWYGRAANGGSNVAMEMLKYLK